MSKYRVGIIAEGPTDISIIEGIVKTIFPEDIFIFNPISPSPKELEIQAKEGGFGWAGVYRVCISLTEKLSLAEEISGRFDCVIIHIDGDVAYKKYSDIGELNPRSDNLPCATASDKYDEVCADLERVLYGWIDANNANIVPCIPYICMETWVGHWLYPIYWTDMIESSDEETVYGTLYRLGAPKSEKNPRLIRIKDKKIRKCSKGYINAAVMLTGTLWNSVTERYIQAEIFDSNLKKMLAAK